MQFSLGSAFALTASLMLAGCVASPSTVTSDVTVFHEFDPAGRALTFAFDPAEKQADSLEYRAYAQLIEDQLRAQGWTPAPESEAQVLVVLDYGIDGGRDEQRAVPIMGQTGVASSSTYGSVGPYGTYSGTTYNTPTYGVTGVAQVTDRVYRRQLALSVVRADRNRKVYEATVISEGSTGQLAPIMPYLVQSLFSDFPGKNGATRSVSIPMEGE